MDEWVNWAKQVRAISQIGRAYSKDAYDLERYGQLADIATAMISRLAGAPTERVANFFVPDSGYATPKVDLRAGVFQDEKILLVKERSDIKWSLPGGWADVCEGPRQGIEREVFEESGYRVTADRLVAVKDRSLHDYRPQYPDHLYKLFFLCDVVGGGPVESIEVSEVSFFPLDGLPELSPGRVLREDIELLWEHFNEPTRAIYCD